MATDLPKISLQARLAASDAIRLESAPVIYKAITGIALERSGG